MKRCRALAWSLTASAILLASPVQGETVDGRAIYNFRCYFCHGYSGDAQTLAAQMLSPKPRDFTSALAAQLTRQQMIAAVTEGKAGTAMKPFASLLSTSEIAAVVDFVRTEFVRERAVNTRYHTAENGWPDHDRFSAAFPYVKGEVALDAPVTQLTAELQLGRRLYLDTCISCHDIARTRGAGIHWSSEAVSYPRTGFATGQFLEPPDAYSGATSFTKHDVAPVLADATAEERLGEALFQQNCAFCHAADGTGKNWIGTFMLPHPRNLTSHDAMSGMTMERLGNVIRDGIPGTSMPAWGAVLDDSQIHDIVSYIRKAFFPSLQGG